MDSKKLFPLFLFPTLILFIDDDPLFLDSIKFLLPKEINTKMYINPNEAINFIKQSESNLENILREFIKTESEEQVINESSYFVDIKDLKNIKNSITTSLYPSVIFVDYNMPLILGINFCKKIEKFNLKKVLMTAGMEHRKALEAFNDGNIDYFIQKYEDDLKNEIIQIIQKMEIKFFLQFSSKIGFIRIIDGVAEYNKLIMKYIKKHKIVEFYAIDNVGSYVFFNSKGKEGYFICLNESAFDDIVSDLLSDSQNKNIIKKLKSKEYMPVFINDADRFLPVMEWEKILVKIEGYLIIENEKLYYSFLWK